MSILTDSSKNNLLWVCIWQARAKDEETSQAEYGTVIPAQVWLGDETFALRASQPQTNADYFWRVLQR